MPALQSQILPEIASRPGSALALPTATAQLGPALKPVRLAPISRPGLESPFRPARESRPALKSHSGPALKRPPGSQRSVPALQFPLLPELASRLEPPLGLPHSPEQFGLALGLALLARISLPGLESRLRPELEFQPAR